MLLPLSTLTNTAWIPPDLTRELRNRGGFIQHMESLNMTTTIHRTLGDPWKKTIEVTLQGNRHITWELELISFKPAIINDSAQ